MASQKLKIVSLELKLSIVEILFYCFRAYATVLLASLSGRNLGSGCLIIVSSL